MSGVHTRAGVLGAGTTSVLLRLVEMQAAGERLTIDSIAAHTGVRRSTVHYHLRALRRAGLVDWASGRQGTLTLRVEVAAPKVLDYSTVG